VATRPPLRALSTLTSEWYEILCITVFSKNLKNILDTVKTANIVKTHKNRKINTVKHTKNRKINTVKHKN
jgi:hypothetical protein